MHKIYCGFKMSSKNIYVYIYLFIFLFTTLIHSVHLIALNELHLNYFLNILNQLDGLTNDFKWLSMYCILVFIFFLTGNILLLNL